MKHFLLLCISLNISCAFFIPPKTIRNNYTICNEDVGITTDSSIINTNGYYSTIITKYERYTEEKDKRGYIDVIPTDTLNKYTAENINLTTFSI